MSDSIANETRDGATVSGAASGSALCQWCEMLGTECGAPATFLVSMPGRHKLPVCSAHVKNYQDEDGQGRFREDQGVRYVIEPNNAVRVK